MFLSLTWQTKVVMLAIDEAHCISEWGEDFRTDYTELNQLRSFFNVPVMALTATSTTKVKDDIMSNLNLTDDDTDIIFKSPDRPNIYIQTKKRESNDYQVSLSWLINHVKEHGVKSKKTIVYCRSIDRVSEIFVTLKDCLDTFAYANGTKSSENLLVEMFHKSTHTDSKDRIIKEFKKENSRIRCVIATVALGMGLDIRDIELVVHIGCPKSVLSYWQEAGRCARDGRDGLSLILYDGFTLSLKSTAKEMAQILKNTSEEKCIRLQILNHLSAGSKLDIITKTCRGCESHVCKCQSCRCCSVCAKKCPCHERCLFDVEAFLKN